MRRHCTASDFARCSVLQQINRYYTPIKVASKSEVDELQDMLQEEQTNQNPAEPYWKKIGYQYKPCAIKDCERGVAGVHHILCYDHLKKFVGQMEDRNSVCEDCGESWTTHKDDPDCWGTVL